MTATNLENAATLELYAKGIHTNRPYDDQHVLEYVFPPVMEWRLQSEQGWTPEHTQAVLQEYRRFLHLAATAPHPVTPSKVVDEAWHLHLTFTRDYWENLTPLLPNALHHEPASGEPGNSQDAAHYRDQYRRTLSDYRAVFGEDAPAHIWPDPDRSPDTGRTQGRRMRRKGKPLVVLAAVILAALAGHLTGSFMVRAALLAVLVLVGLGMAVGTSPRHDRRGSSDGSGCSSVGASCGSISDSSGCDPSGDSGGGCDSSGDSGGSSCGSSCGSGCGGGCGS